MRERGKRTLRVVRKAPEREEDKKSEKKPLRPAQCRAHAKRELAHHFPAIVESLVKRAEAGSFQHVRLVTELLEVRSGKDEKTGRKGSGLLARVLREMETEDAEKKQASAIGD